MKFTKRINLTKTFLAFLFVSMVFSLNIFAQKNTTEQMGEKAVADLIKELKGVVMRLSPDKREAKLVSKKWDRRKGLGEKSKKEVIELLFEDVKSVIKDSGTQYQIYSVFSFYKNIQTQKNTDKESEWVGKDSGELLEKPEIKSRLKKLLGEKDYASFRQNFEVGSPIKKEGDFLFASGCMLRACTRLESALALNVKNKTIHVAIFDQIKETKFFNENNSQTPEIITNWAKCLESSKPAESQDEAILFDEFQYQNSEEFMARFDAFAVALQDNPENKGYIIIYGDKKSYATKEKEIKEYSARRLGSKKLNYLKGEGNSKAVIAFWVVPKGANPPTPRKSLTKNKEKIADNKPESILVDEFSLTNREDFLLRFDNYVSEIQNRPQASGYIVLSRGKKSRANSKKEIIDYIKLRMFNIDRFIFLDGKDSKKVSIKLWIVPKGAEPPAPKKIVNQKNEERINE